MIEIHHVGVVSKDLDSALRYFQIDKSQIDEIIDDDIQNHILHIIHLPKHSMWLEILVPKNEKSTTFNFAKKFSGLNVYKHSSFKVYDAVGVSSLAIQQIFSIFPCGLTRIPNNKFLILNNLIVNFSK